MGDEGAQHLTGLGSDILFNMRCMFRVRTEYIEDNLKQLLKWVPTKWKAVLVLQVTNMLMCSMLMGCILKAYA